MSNMDNGHNGDDGRQRIPVIGGTGLVGAPVTRKEDIMSTSKAFINRHPVLTYFVLTFAISWGGFLLVVGAGGFAVTTSWQTDPLFPFAILAMLAGPSVAGFLLTSLVYGRVGLREFLSRLLKWRAGARWYAVALLTAPLLMMVILLALSLLSPEFLPSLFASDDTASHLLMGLATGLAAGIFEELGWTGFAIPRLRQRYSLLATGLIVGLLWAVWHLPVVFWVGYASGTVSGALSLASYLIDPFLFLVAFRVLMVWVYDRTGSLLVAMLMHLSPTASSRILTPLGIVGVPLLTFDLVWAATLWVVVAAVVKSGQLSRQPVNQSLPREIGRGEVSIKLNICS